MASPAPPGTRPLHVERQLLFTTLPYYFLQPIVQNNANNLSVAEQEADDDTSQDAADLNSQESKDEKSKSEKSKSEKSEKLVKKEPAPVDAFVHVIGHPDEQNSPKSASLKKDNLVIVDKPLEQSHSEVGIS